MSGLGRGHLDGLHRPGHTRVHRLAPQAKIVASFVVTVAAVTTPPQARWVHALLLGCVVGLVVLARLGLRLVLARMVVAIPFLLAAGALVLFGDNATDDAIALSARITIGTLAAVVLTATTPILDIVRGLQRLRVPRVIVAVMAFMVRYLDVIVGELERQRVAMLARGHEARWLAQVGPTARSMALVFIRSYERGERVAVAMAARGYDGALPPLHARPAPLGDWLTVAAFGLVVWSAVAVSLAFA